MTLLEMSLEYEASAAAIRKRISELREIDRNQTDEEHSRRLRLRIAALTPLLRESRELASLTAHYYDRSYHHEKYTI
jgi:hypothetical protein